MHTNTDDLIEMPNGPPVDELLQSAQKAFDSKNYFEAFRITNEQLLNGRGDLTPDEHEKALIIQKKAFAYDTLIPGDTREFLKMPGHTKRDESLAAKYREKYPLHRVPEKKEKKVRRSVQAIRDEHHKKVLEHLAS